MSKRAVKNDKITAPQGFMTHRYHSTPVLSALLGITNSVERLIAQGKNPVIEIIHEGNGKIGLIACQCMTTEQLAYYWSNCPETDGNLDVFGAICLIANSHANAILKTMTETE